MPTRIPPRQAILPCSEKISNAKGHLLIYAAQVVHKKAKTDLSAQKQQEHVVCSCPQKMPSQPDMLVRGDP